MVIEETKKRYSKKKISFEKEIVTKDVAAKILSECTIKEETPNKDSIKDQEATQESVATGSQNRKKKRKKKDKTVRIVNPNHVESSTSEVPPKKKKKGKSLAEDQANDVNSKNEEGDTTEGSKKKKNKTSLLDHEANDLNLQNEESNSTEGSKKKKKKGKNLDDHEADDLNMENEETNATEGSKKKKKKRKNLADHEIDDNEETNSTEGSKKKKKKKDLVENQPEPEEESAGAPEKKKSESIRAQKRKKHAKLLADKKIQSEITYQQKSLNYLSKWKHSRSDWKFEKLRQVWLQQNMLDVNKVPDEFWETLLEYFSSSKGQARAAIMKEAVQWVEKEGEENSEENKLKIQRAREIVQNLQE